MSTYAGAYQWDVFVSYASVDDVPVLGESGWVTDFVEALSRTLDALSGRRERIRIFKDTFLPRQERFSEAIDHSVQSSAVLLALLSPGFENSPFCKRELQLFAAAGTRQGAGVTTPGGLQRVVPVRLAGRKLLGTGPLISDVMGYDFADGESSSFPVNSRSEDFVSGVRDLAVGVMAILNDLREHGGDVGGGSAAWLAGHARQTVTRILTSPVLRLNDEDRRLALIRRAFADAAPGLCAYLERVGGRNVDEWAALTVVAAADYGGTSEGNAVADLLAALPDISFLDQDMLMKARAEVAQCWRSYLQNSITAADVRHSRRLFAHGELEFLIDQPGEFWSPAWELRSGERWKRMILMTGPTSAVGGTDGELATGDLRLLTGLRHRNIVPVEDFLRAGPMLLAECGWRLGDHLKALDGPMGLSEVKNYIEQLADALDFAHLRGLVHGRLSPASVLVDHARNYVSILGFGYALDGEHETARRVWEVSRGFDICAAPEVWRGRPVPASDQYSLAVLTCGLLLGVKAIGTSIDSLRGSAADLLPGSTAEVIETALASDPRRRFGSTMEFADAVKWALDTGMSQSGDRAKEHAYLSLLRQECVQATVGYVRLAGRRSGRNSRYSVPEAGATGAGRVRVQHPMLFRVSHASSQESPRLTEDVSRDMRSGGRILVLGEPGSGKSTTLIHAALEACREAQLDRGAPIPVVVPLNLYDGHQPLHDFIRAQMPGLEPEYDRLLSDNRLLLLFDALNEMGSEGRREISMFVRNLRDFVVSCRTKDYEQDLEDVTSLTLITILPLDIPAIKLAFEKQLGSQSEYLWAQVTGCPELLGRYQKMRLHGEPERFWEAGYTPEYTSDKEDAAWTRMNQHGVLELCRNPFLLRVITDIFRSEGEVPQERSAIFSVSIQTLIRRELNRVADTEGWGVEDSRRTDLEDLIREALSEVAGLIQERQSGAGVACELAAMSILPDVPPTSRERLLGLAEDANILIRQADRFVFNHQLVQEFFASSVMREEFEGGGSAQRFFPAESWYRPQGWEETAIILAGVLGGARAQRFVRWVAEAQPAVALRCIEESGVPGLAVTTLSEELKTWLRERWLRLWTDEEQRPLARTVVGKALASVGDPRPGTGVTTSSGVILPDIEWIDLDDLSIKISKYPVTLAQYQCFVNSRLTAGDGNAAHNAGCATWPITGISWTAADEFATWLGAELQLDMRLPTEAEWMRAAEMSLSVQATRLRDKGRIQEAGNVADASGGGGGSPSPVGTYGDWAGCIADMVGNVWEWCQDGSVVFTTTSPNDQPPTGRTFRLLKGGSWKRSSHFAGVGYQYWAPDDYTSDDIGFRLVWDYPGGEVISD